MELFPQLSLSIIAHELQPFGCVTVNTSDSTVEVSDVRIPSCARGDSSFLYVIGDGYEMPSGLEEGCLTLYVGIAGADRKSSLVLETEKSVIEIFAVLQDIVYRYHHWEQKMDSLLLGGGSVQDILDASENFLINHLVVVDPALKLLAYSRHVDCDDPVTVELINHGYHTDGNIKKFKLNKRFGPWSRESGFIVNESYQICRYVTVVYSFKTESAFSLIAVMMCNRAKPEPYLFDIYRIFLRRLEHFARREYPKTKPAGNMVDSFIRDLLSGDLTEPAAIVERSMFAKIPLEGKFCLFCISLGKAEDEPTMRVISEVAQKTAPAKVIFFEEYVIVFCFNCRDRHSRCSRDCRVCSLECAVPEAVDCAEATTTVVSRIEDVLGCYGLLCGRSALFTDLSQMRVAYLQARTAVDLGTMREHGAETQLATSSAERHGKCILNFDDCLFRFMLERGQVEGEDIIGKGSACRILEHIERYDETHGTDNYLFLKTYLRLERRMSAVADVLHMHRNNVRYRADRIEKIFSIDTDDYRTRGDLLCAFMIRETSQA